MRVVMRNTLAEIDRRGFINRKSCEFRRLKSRPESCSFNELRDFAKIHGKQPSNRGSVDPVCFMLQRGLRSHLVFELNCRVVWRCAVAQAEKRGSTASCSTTAAEEHATAYSSRDPGPPFRVLPAWPDRDVSPA